MRGDFLDVTRHMIDGYALHEIICDAAGRPVDYRYLEVNPAFERLTGFAADRIVGRTVLEVMPQTEPEWIERFGNVALTGQELHCEDYAREIGGCRHDTARGPRGIWEAKFRTWMITSGSSTAWTRTSASP